MLFKNSNHNALRTVVVVAIALTTWAYFANVKTKTINIKTPGMPPFLKHRFTDAGLGHKFAELLFSMDEAHNRTLLRTECSWQKLGSAERRHIQDAVLEETQNHGKQFE